MLIKNNSLSVLTIQGILLSPATKLIRMLSLTDPQSNVGFASNGHTNAINN